MTVERVQRVIDKMTVERERFVAWVRGVPDEKWPHLSPNGNWQARDYVSHLASIDPLLTGLARAFQQSGGIDDGRGSGRRFDIDEWNEGKILARRAKSTQELIDEMAKNRAELNAAFVDFTDEQLDASFHFAGDSKRSPRDLKVAEFLNGLTMHDRWHMEDARRALEGEAEQPFGDASFQSMLQGRTQAS